MAGYRGHGLDTSAETRQAYDACAVRSELRRGRILPVISRRGAPNIKGLAVRWERLLDLHNAFVSLGCGLICLRRLKKAAGP
jgi:hypothetical protein